MGNIYQERIELLRSMMRAKEWDAVIITGSDPHSSEYPADRWKQVQWISGFTGEAGDIVVTLDHAGLWTDTRYFIQAKRQLEGTGIELHKTRVPEQILIPEWLGMQLDSDAVIAVDGLCVGADFAASLPCAVTSVPDMLGVLWKDRPLIPQTPIFTIEAGETRHSKIEWLRQFIKEKECGAIFISALDEIAWLLNARASDIEYNPLVISYLLLTETEVKWYVLKDTIEDPDTKATTSILEADGIQVLPYNEVSFLSSEFSGRLFIDPATTNYEIYSRLVAEECALEEGTSPIPLRKAVKNGYEIEGMKEMHLRDGIAMTNFLYWLENGIASGESIDEWEASVKLARLREEADEYRGDSFETISAYGAGAALPHYITPHKDAPLLEAHGLYLCDSGAQYTRGTTDITRTIPLGPCTELEREDYTLVLKGHIQLAMAVFPAGTAGCQIDALAREALWRSKRNFGHGTGHGVGFFLGVHEGPADIRQNFNATPLLPGMILSNEPGIYREGMHGVRHENLLLVVDAGSNEFGSWRSFEPLTMCHFDTSILKTELMTHDETEWLNAYNEKVYISLAPGLSPEVRQWLRDKTRPVE